MSDTIVAVSSGRPPAAIAVIRLSGVSAFAAVTALAGSVPKPREARLRTLRDAGGGVLDRALILAFPGPASATGEDVVELHCHGGRAVVAAVEAALLARPGIRRAEPGEFTRRALLHGRIDLAEAQGLADLLAAETEAQRLAALGGAEGRISQAVRRWLEDLAHLSAATEAMLDFADESDVADDDGAVEAVRAGAERLARELAELLDAPPVERLRDGIRVVIAGPPNAGKSTLLNLLSEREAAIVAPVAGTTRDRIEVAVQRGGLPFLLTDTAGLHAEADDAIEQEGMARAMAAATTADLLIWLGDDPPPRADALWLHGRTDQPGRERLPSGPSLAVSRGDRASVTQVWHAIDARARALVPRADQFALDAGQRRSAAEAADWLSSPPRDPLALAEHLRRAHRALGRIIGLDVPEAMLDALFGRFCLGK